MNHILILHGPNLNLIGLREPDIYGAMSLSELNEQLSKQAQKQNISLEILQSNSESTLINAIHDTVINNIEGIIINPAAFTHTSIALRDALLAVNLPFFEVHISNLYTREPFRHHSYFSDIAQGVISGFGLNGYFFALTQLIQQLQ